METGTSSDVQLPCIYYENLKSYFSVVLHKKPHTSPSLTKRVGSRHKVNSLRWMPNVDSLQLNMEMLATCGFR